MKRHDLLILFEAIAVFSATSINFDMQEFLTLSKNGKSVKGEKSRIKAYLLSPSFFKQNGGKNNNILASYCVCQFSIAQRDNCQMFNLLFELM